MSEKLLAACRSKTPDINEIRGYLEQEECDVNIREDDEVCVTYVNLSVIELSLSLSSNGVH